MVNLVINEKYIEFSDLFLEWLGHAAFRIKIRGKYIYIDPFKIDVKDKADFIFITHSHYDHFSPEDIKKIEKETTKIFAPFDVNYQNVTHLKPNEKLELSLDNSKLIIETYPAYNIDKPFHPKENNWLSYKLTFELSEKVAIFHTGDSDVIPEFLNLKDIDILLIPVSGTYVMNSKEAADLCNKLKPKIAIPMHYGTIVGSLKDAEDFKRLCEYSKVVILNKK